MQSSLTPTPRNGPGAHVVEAGTYLTMLAAAVAAGTVQPTARVALSATCIALLGLATLIKAGRPGPLLRLTPLGVLGVALLLVTVLQAVPLPAAWVQWLSPAAMKLHQQAAEFPGLPTATVATATLSVAPAATWQSVVNLAGYLCAFLLATSFFADDGGRRRRLRLAFVGCGIFVVLIGFLNRLAFGHSMLGLFELPARHFSGTFVNPNHLAGFLGLCLPVTVGVALQARPLGKRITLLWAAAMLGVGVLMTLSRGGIVAFFAGQLLLLWMLHARRTGCGRTASAAAVWIPPVVLTVLACAGWLALGALLQELGTIVPELAALLGFDDAQRFGKHLIWIDALHLVRDYPLVGIGAGAFEEAFPAYKSLALPMTFTHVENEYLQALCDYGVFGVILVGAALATVGAAIFRAVSPSGGRGRDAATAAALFVVALHNAADFNLSTGGVALPVALLAGLVMVRAPASHRGWVYSKRTVKAALAALAALVTFASMQAFSGSLEVDERRLLIAQRKSPEDSLRLAHLGIQRHPADYILAMHVANNYLRAGDGRNAAAALYWTKRALRQCPTFALAHLLAGRLLLEQGDRERAAMELQLADAINPRLGARAEALKYLERPPERLRARLDRTDASKRVGLMLGRQQLSCPEFLCGDAQHAEKESRSPWESSP